MLRWLIVIMAAAMIMTACGNSNKKENADDKPADSLQLKGEFKVMGSQTLYPMMVKWSSVFIQDHPGVKMIVRGVPSEKAMSLLGRRECQVAMISRPLTEEEKAMGYFAVPVALDAVMPVFSFDNHHIQPLVMNGLSREKLAAAFTGKITRWGELARRAGNEEINVYCLDDSSGTAAFWAGYLGLELSAIKGQRCATEVDMVRRLSNDPGGLGYCSILGAYDLQTGLKKKGIYILPMDLNADGTINDNEQYYDKLSILSDAVMNGKLPSPPVRELYLVCPEKPADPAINAFIRWILGIGQNYMPEMGYIHLPADKAQKAAASLN